VIFTMGNTPPALAAKAGTQTIPIVFTLGADPVEIGLVASLPHPGGNVTGTTALAAELLGKRLGLLHELVPASTIAFLVNRTNPAFSESLIKSLTELAMARLGVKLLVLDTSTPGDIDRAFATMAAEGVGGLFLGDDVFFNAQREQLVALAASRKIPASYSHAQFVEIGGLMSYSGDFLDAYRWAGRYVGRILKGEKPADLPVQQATKLEFTINLKTAKTLGLAIPAGILAIADEVIE
jgi:putative tryptophan/tyrosine transport system substrate-binding protein